MPSEAKSFTTDLKIKAEKYTSEFCVYFMHIHINVSAYSSYNIHGVSPINNFKAVTKQDGDMFHGKCGGRHSFFFSHIYILTAENLGVCFSFFLENYLMDFSQTLPFSSLYCSQGYKQKSEMCCYFCLATKCEICQNLPVLAPIYGHF